MDILLALTLSFFLFLFSTLSGYFVAYPLLAAMIIFLVTLWRRGFPILVLLRMAIAGSQASFSVIYVLLLIGAVTASWMAAGTVPAIVYYGVQWIDPQFFILTAFILTSLVSLLIGTSFGTVSTIGVALMVMGSGSGVNRALIAGAIIAGAYVGDRASPMSSSAHLVATVTQTRLYSNIRNMWRTAGWALLLSVVFYALLSLLHPVQMTSPTFLAELQRVFQIHPIQLLPALIILVLSLLQVEVKRAMLASIAGAIALSLAHLHHSPLALLRFLLLGFRLSEPSELQSILLGGGVLAMLRVSLVVVISTAFVGLFAGTQVLQPLENWLQRLRSRRQLFLGTLLVGLGSAAFGCTQTIAILLTRQLMAARYQATYPQPDGKYEENEKAGAKLALDLENTVVVLSPLVPWNIAGLVPATILGVNAGFIPFALFLYLLPLLNLLDGSIDRFSPLRLCNLRLKKRTNS